MERQWNLGARGQCLGRSQARVVGALPSLDQHPQAGEAQAGQARAGQAQAEGSQPRHLPLGEQAGAVGGTKTLVRWGWC